MGLFHPTKEWDYSIPPKNGDYFMNLQQIPLISIVLFFPLAGAVILFFVKK